MFQPAVSVVVATRNRLASLQNGLAFLLPNGGSPETPTSPGSAATPFGMNHQGNLVGQFTANV